MKTATVKQYGNGSSVVYVDGRPVFEALPQNHVKPAIAICVQYVRELARQGFGVRFIFA